MVDPYFFSDSRYTLPLAGILKIAGEAKSTRCNDKYRIFIVCDQRLTSEKHIPYAEFERACRSQIERLVPDGVEVTIVRFKEKTGSRKLHNRYIIGDVGGIVVAWGLDAPNAVDVYDDLSIMSREQFTHRTGMYSLDTDEFDIPEEPITLSRPHRA